MAIGDFNPEIWAAMWEHDLSNAVVFGAGTNRNYEGEIRAYGDTVKIPAGNVNPTIRDYKQISETSSAIAAPESNDGTLVDLIINKQKYWHVAVDDIAMVQSRVDHMEELVRRGTRAMAYQIDDDIQAVFKTAAVATRTTADAQAKTAVVDGHFTAVNTLAQMMDEADIPESGRFMIVPPVFMARVWKHLAGLDVASATSGAITAAAPLFVPATAEESLRNGFRGRLRGFDIMVSNRIAKESSDAKQPCYAGHPSGITWAAQLTEMEAYRVENQFADAVKALMVYGIKAVWADRIFELTINI